VCVPSHQLDFPVFDADNHMYETQEALTKFLPSRYKGAIDYIDVHGRTKIVVRGHISDYIPNPTFEVVAAPGAQEDYFRNGNPENKTYREIMGTPMRAIPAFREPAPRLELMDELGLDRALMFPTLASLVEERMKDDVDLTHIVIHALNEWMYETWSFNYRERIFATPVVTLPIVDKAIEELEWCLERGARTVLIRPAPVPGYKGSRSPGLPEFDPFWARVVEAGIPVSMHASDSGYAEFLNVWEGTSEFLPFRPTAFRSVAMGKRPIEDTMAALVCHGALSRFPTLKIAAVENGANWVPHLLQSFASTYSMMPGEFAEDPVVAFKRNIYINPFWEDDLKSLVDIVGADHVLFGSDYPHPEGLADPLSYVKELDGLDTDSVAKIMGGNLAGLMGIAA
jgi:predicted TIM-barrel fold metal-dependent hydrolase